jgi:hypothetical protein
MAKVLISTGQTYFTANQAMKVLTALKDKYPFLQYVSRTGRGEMWNIKQPLVFGRQLIQNYIINMDEKWFDIRTNTDRDTVIFITPVYHQMILTYYANKFILGVAHLNRIYDVPNEALEIAKLIQRPQ